MEIKDIIKKRREELNLTYEQLGNMVGVGKSTVRKWETGLIENMRRDNIVALSKALNISPAIIMGWQTIEDNNRLILSQQETTLLESFNKLDKDDKNKVIDYTQLLSNQDKYKTITDTTDEITATTEDEFTIAKKKALEARRKAEQYFKENPHLMPVASHDKEGNFTDEDYKHDDDIMNNDDLWND